MKRADQSDDILPIPPRRQSGSLKTAYQLIIGTQRVVGLCGADTDQSNTQLITQKAQHVQEPRLFADRTGLQAVDLIDHQ